MIPQGRMKKTSLQRRQRRSDKEEGGKRESVTEATGRNFAHSFIKHLLCQTFVGAGKIVMNAKFLAFMMITF